MENKKDSPNPNIDRKQVKKVIDKIEFGLNDPEALRVIDERAKELLIKIRDRIKEVKDTSFEAFDNAEDGPGHGKFKETYTTDASAVSMALQNDDLPKKFFAPIVGKQQYLEHILVCPACLIMVADGAKNFQEGAFNNQESAEIFNESKKELLSRGIKIKDDHEDDETIETGLDLPKPN